MQHMQNATPKECIRMQTNAPCPMHSECTDGNATQIQQPQRMQRVRNASELYIMLQILNASRPKCSTNVFECIEKYGMHENACRCTRARTTRIPGKNHTYPPIPLPLSTHTYSHIQDQICSRSCSHLTFTLHDMVA